ncbi:hypothetical protein [Mucilaginibacter psychrotolerans]|uniref:Uncharacterized protein n=1 Tax=Mucilaginibacter psychrotolerans TaxID=1524096 RepID=A0A4Y8RXP4_9SPHI|nr:hypothetical protein [Mucilaginibacter psychrotolerans]TFF30452.1 hypothetical protein E2R66_27195 [Mucilaginibacter psychrotolerans]
MNSYKKMQAVVLGLALMAITTSCRQNSTTVIETDDNGSTKRIEYSGQVVFSKDKTGIDYISKGGYVKFERNGRKIEAENDSKGKVTYKYDGGDGVAVLGADGKQFLAQAMQEISREQDKIRAAAKKAN